MITFFPADFVALKDALMKLFLLQGFMIFSFIILASIHHYDHSFPLRGRHKKK